MRSATLATVSGIVRDSIGRRVLSGARVQLVSADASPRWAVVGVTDTVGHYVLPNVPDGQYLLSFFHPVLDSLSLEPMVHAVTVRGHGAVAVDLAVPSPSRLRRVVCGERSAPDSGALVFGMVRDAVTGAPLGGARVVAAWYDLAIRRGAMSRQLRAVTTTATDNGAFAVCNAPAGGTVGLLAIRGADSTPIIDVPVPADGFVRRELLIAPPRATGAMLSGPVVNADGGAPLAGARVGVIGGPQVRANEKGEWTIADAPAGTRMLEVRAIGFYPERRAVDVTQGAPVVRTMLSTMRAVLDTVRITAQRRTRDLTEFNDRRRSGQGQYTTADQIARLNPVTTSDLFRNMQAVHLDFSDDAGVRLQLRGTLSGWCTPAIFVDGSRISGFDGFIVPGLTLDEIDSVVRPNEIAGIEVYPGSSAPMQYRQMARVDVTARAQIASTMNATRSTAAREAGGALPSTTLGSDDSNCGSILIWTKPFEH